MIMVSMILYVNPDRLLANDHMLVIYMYFPIIQTVILKILIEMITTYVPYFGFITLYTTYRF